MKREDISKAVYDFLWRFRSESWIAFFGLVIAAAAWGSVVHRSAYEFSDQVADIYELNNGLAKAFEEHVRFVLKSADSTLQFLKMEHEEKDQTIQRMNSYVQKLKGYRVFNQLAIADAGGDVIVSSIPLKGPVNIAFHEYFREHGAEPDAGLIISKPVMSPLSGTWTVFVSRRLNRQDGSFAGVVSVGLDPGHFSEFYRVPELEGNRSITIVGRDGIVRTDHADDDFSIGGDIGSGTLFSRISDTLIGKYEYVSARDGMTRYVSFRAMQDYPLIVMVGSSKSQGLSAFGKRKRGYYASALAFTVFTAISCLLLIRARRQMSSRQALLDRELRERRKAEKLLRESERNLQIIDRINIIFLTVEGDEVYDELLKCILEYSESAYGLFGYLDGNGNFVAPAVTREILWQECNVAGKDKIFNEGFFPGIWKRALEERKTLIFNEGPFNVPHGHLPIHNTMVAPVFLGKYFVCITQVANKTSGYGEEDRALLESVADQIAPVLYARLQRDKHEKERRKVEEFLSYREKRYRELFEAITDGLMVYEFSPGDLPGRFFEVNDVACRMLGYTREELLTMSPADITAPISGVDFIAIAKRLEAGETVTFEQVYVAKEGRRIPVEITVRVFDLEKKLAAMAMVRDITRRKLAEIELRESEERYHLLFDKSPDAIMIVDTECKIVECNAAAYKQLGCVKEESGLYSVPDVCPLQTAEKGCGRMEELIRKGSDQFEVKHCTKNGEIRDVFVVTQTISMNGQTFVYMIWRDITDRKKAEQEIMNYQTQLRSLVYESSLIEERERKRIADELHETIGQNLAFSKLRLSSLRDTMAAAGEAETLEEILGMIDSTIQFSRSLTHELGNPVLYLVGFEAAVRWLAEQIRKTQNIQFDVSINGSLADIQMEMRVLLYKTVRELLFNVVKHAQADYVSIKIRRVSDKLEIDVMDNGVGVCPLPGSGYGLISVTERINYLGGTLETLPNTDTGTGTRVSIVVPLPQNSIEVALP